jgi:hypothetical protein
MGNYGGGIFFRAPKLKTFAALNFFNSNHTLSPIVRACYARRTAPIDVAGTLVTPALSLRMSSSELENSITR